MRALKVVTFLTLDGVMQAPGGQDEDPTGGFALGGWSASYWDEQMEQAVAASLAAPFDMLLGRRTYEIFAAHWPYVENDAVADSLNKARKYLVSSTIRKPTWQNTTILDGDFIGKVADLKAQDGPEIQVHGSSEVVQALLREGLVDELRIWCFPIVVGTGKRLFGLQSAPAGLTLRECSTSSTGVVMGVWERSGPVTPGSFALEEPSADEVLRRAELSS